MAQAQQVQHMMQVAQLLHAVHQPGSNQMQVRLKHSMKSCWDYSVGLAAQPGGGPGVDVSPCVSLALCGRHLQIYQQLETMFQHDPAMLQTLSMILAHDQIGADAVVSPLMSM